MSDKTVLKEVNDEWIELNTPIMDCHNDGLQLYLRKIENNYVISDDGYTLTDLLHSGVNTETSKRREIIDNILTSHNVTLSDGALQIHTTAEDFSSRKNDLIMAILEIAGLHVTAGNRVVSFSLKMYPSGWIP